MEALISKLCSRWASMYQLGVKKASLALERSREQPIEWTSHYDCDCRRKRKNIVGARANVEIRCLSNCGPGWHHCYVTAFSRRTWFPDTSKSPAPATTGLQAVSLMTGLIPDTLCCLLLREPCSSLLVCTLRASQMASAVRQDVVMVQCAETARLMRKHGRFSIVSQSQMIWQNPSFFLITQ